MKVSLYTCAVLLAGALSAAPVFLSATTVFLFTTTVFAQEVNESVPQAETTAPVPGTFSPLPLLPEIPETRVAGRAEGAGSQGTATPGGTILETPTRTGTPLANVGSSTSVITAEQIEQKKQTSVLEVLRGLPGVDVVQQGGPGRVASVFIRGASSEQTKVLLDGIPMNDPISPGRGFDFSNLSVDNIERIEVIRGPQSALYGSDAIGGVISIITKKGQGPLQSRVAAMGGSFGTSRETGNVSGGNQRYYYSLGGSYFNTNGFSAADSRLPGNTERDGFRLGTVAGRAGWTPTENFDVDFVFRYNQSTADIDRGGGAFQDDPNQTNFTKQNFTRTQLRYLDPNEVWEQKLSYSTADSNRKNNDPTDFLHPFDSFFSKFNGRTQLVDWQHNLFLHDTNTLTVGAIHQQEDGGSSFAGTFDGGGFPVPFDGTSSSRALRDTAVYAQDQIRLFDRWFTTVGARQDHYSQAGTANTYRLTTLYRVPVTETALRGSLGTGFKAPTIFQLFDGFSGNPNLRPEESKGWDCGIDQPLWDGRVLLAATYFHNDFTNLIDFNPSTFSFFNVGRAVSKGVELSSVFQLDEVTSLTASYTRLNTRDLATDLTLLRRPANKASLGINRRLLNNKANVNLTGLFVGNRDDKDFTAFPAARVVVPHYIVVNAAGSYDLTPRSQVFVRVDNLFNERYQEVFGFGTPPLSAYGGMAFNW